jgi:hypothetical protein
MRTVTWLYRDAHGRQQIAAYSRLRAYGANQAGEWRPITDEALERFTIHKLHRIKVVPAAFSKVRCRGYIGMTNTGRGSGFPHETAPGRFIIDELCANDLESHRAPEMGINGFVGYSHATASELHRFSIFASKKLVVLKMELVGQVVCHRRFGLHRQAQ